MTRLPSLLLVTILLATALFASDQSTDEEKVWSLEQDYWRFVQTNDLDHYRGLWHPQFLGWPTMSPEPVRKEHITDWITAHASKGDTLKSYRLERLTTQEIDNNVTTTYRVTAVWADKDGKEQPGTVRIIHTWLRNAHGTWEIVSGMSAPTNAEGH